MKLCLVLPANNQTEHHAFLFFSSIEGRMLLKKRTATGTRFRFCGQTPFARIVALCNHNLLIGRCHGFCCVKHWAGGESIQFSSASSKPETRLNWNAVCNKLVSDLLHRQPLRIFQAVGSNGILQVFFGRAGLCSLRVKPIFLCLTSVIRQKVRTKVVFDEVCSPK